MLVDECTYEGRCKSLDEDLCAERVMRSYAADRGVGNRRVHADARRGSRYFDMFVAGKGEKVEGENWRVLQLLCSSSASAVVLSTSQ